MTDFETRVQEILNSEEPNHVKLAEIRKLYTPKIDPTTCKNDRLYRITVGDEVAISWRINYNEYQCHFICLNGRVRWAKDRDVTVLGEYHPEDEYVGKVYERIEDALEDGMGQYTVLKGCNGSRWVVDKGVEIRNDWAPFTVLHWVPKEEGE